SIDLFVWLQLAREIFYPLIFFSIALLIFWRKFDDFAALLVSVDLVLFGASSGALVKGVAAVSTSPVHVLFYMDIFSGIFLIVLFFIFPNGKFVPSWTRWMALFALALQVPRIVPSLQSLDITNIMPLGPLVMVALVGSCGYAQIYRFRRISNPVQRQQIKWVIAGFMAVVVEVLLYVIIIIISINAGSPIIVPGQGRIYYFLFGLPLLGLLIAFFPLSLGIAILRYRLWDIDIFINRSLVYGALTLLVIGLYVVVVSSLGILFQTTGNLPISLLATGTIAVAFQPLRDRLQRSINHLMYGERDDPYTVLSRLGQRLESTLKYNAVLPTIAETVAQALKLPYVAITLRQGDEFSLKAAYHKHGLPAQNLTASVVLPLSYQGEVEGQMLLAPRAPGEPFTPADQRLLEDLGHQAGIALHAIRLTDDLQRSREKLVLAREEERRRLRRDLHDGLGPSLASLVLKLETAHNLLQRDVPQAGLLLRDMKIQMQYAISDIQRLVYELRPPALDELGLAGAVREFVNSLQTASAVRIQLTTPEQLPHLPAAIEVAAYRIILEALTNVIRHSQAQTCQVRLSVADRLHLEIEDDGQGLPQKISAGVGVGSMRERATELGGSFSITSIPAKGTHIIVTFPLQNTA
ncbi:MAG: hypothetical protein EXR62_17310, partial [Chloroflexi bacterium]|nr:hypothetical protein [Chloroflexota bacterium]